jgi:hypothetical protein
MSNNEQETWWEVQGNYGYGDGWEMLTTHDTRREALESLKEYEDNEPQFVHRVSRKRGRVE